MADDQDNYEASAADEESQRLGMEAPYEGDPSKPVELPDESLASAIRSLTRKFEQQEQYANRWEKIETWKRRMMERGFANGVYNSTSGQFMVDGTAGVTALPDSETAKRATIRRSYNVFLSRERTWAASFSQTPPGTRFEPVDPEDSQDIRAAEEADNMRRIEEKFNSPSKIALKAARYAWTDGRIIGYTRYVADAKRFGLDNNGNPVGREVIDLYGVLESKVPIAASCFGEYPYLNLNDELDTALLKAMYPWVANNIVASETTGADSYARLARISSAEGVQTGEVGDSANFMATRERWWLRPAAYNKASDDVKAQLEKDYPDGLHAIFVGDTLCICRNESMDDHLDVMHAMEGDGQSRTAIGQPMVDPQRVLNDMGSMAEEAFKYVIPMTLINEKLLDIDALQEMESAYGAFVPVELGENKTMQSQLQETAAAVFPPEFMGFMEQLFGPISDTLSSTPPVLAGASMEDVKTAKGYAMARDQALGVIGLTWKPFTEFYASLMGKTIRIAAACREGKVSAIVGSRGVGRKNETVNVTIADLKGNFACFPETDANFPEGYTARSNKIMQLVMNAGSNPATAPLLMQPDNQALIKEAIGIEDLVLPGVQARNKQLDEISEMEGEKPLVNPAFAQWQQQQAQAAQQAQLAAATAQAAGQPPEAAPPPQLTPPPPQLLTTVPIDPDTDDHQAEFDECLRWINSPAGQQAKKDEPGWYANVRLHAMDHKAELTKQAQSQAQQQVQMAQAAKQQAPKPPSETIAFKDVAAMNPAAAATMLQQAGLPAQ